jgi:hypothetical protein
MVTAILPSLTNEEEDLRINALERAKASRIRNRNRHSIARLSAAFSVESEATITPEAYSRSLSGDGAPVSDPQARAGKSSVLAGYVGLFTGCGALLALSCFLPLPARFGEIDDVTPGQAVSYSFYVVSAIALFVGFFVFFGLRNLQGEEGKGWRLLFGLKGRDSDIIEADYSGRSKKKVGIVKKLDAKMLIGLLINDYPRSSHISIS